MTPLESIYEIKSAVMELRRYLDDKVPVVKHRAQGQYVKWVDRFFKENIGVIDPEMKIPCQQDFDYFIKLLDSTAENYYLQQGGG